MRCYENDEMKIPKRYKKMTLEQLEREGQFMEKYAIFVAKVVSIFHKKKKLDSNIKFYI